MTAYAINKVCHLLEADPAFRERLRQDMDAVLAEFKLDEEEKRAFTEGDVATLYRRGGHGLLLTNLPRHKILGLTMPEYQKRIGASRRERV